jgi:nucleoid-associated protein YgaU
MHDDQVLIAADAGPSPIAADAGTDTPPPEARPTRAERRVRLPWSSRVKLAVALSTLILIGVMVVQKFRGGGAPAASSSASKANERAPAAPALAIVGKPARDPEPARSRRPDPPTTLAQNVARPGSRRQEPQPPPAGETVVTPVSLETASSAAEPLPPDEVADDAGSSGTPNQIAALAASSVDDPPPPPAESTSGLDMMLPGSTANSQPESPPPALASHEPNEPFRGLAPPATPLNDPARESNAPPIRPQEDESNREPITDRPSATRGTPAVEPFEPTPVEPHTMQAPAMDVPPTRPIHDPSPTPSETPDDVVGSSIAPVTHVVRRGENFWTIARHYYGSGRFYRALWKANSERVPRIDELYVGTAILVPAPEDLDKALIEPAGTPRGNPRSPVAPADEATARRDGQTRRTSRPDADDGDGPEPPRRRRLVHIVQPNETLRSIARKRLGDARREDELLELNDDLIADPYNLPVGTPLRLPFDPAG